jgi:lipoate-protein ligase A
MNIRIHEAGTVPYLRSQTIYHGLAYARTAGTPDTIVTATPGDPYVCIGFHQDAERELDVEFCERRGLPILRRETGGGAVYLDSDQLFVQWIMANDSLPARVEQRFELFTRPIVETYREFGIDAEFRPVNDVHVDGRKIAGTGAARIGNAEVLVGNFIFDFDTDVMANVLRAPSPMFREQVGMSLRRYMTSMRNEGVPVPPASEVAEVYRDKCGAALGRRVDPGDLTAREAASIEAADERFLSAEFVRQPGGLRWRGVKIHQDVYVVESTQGSMSITATLRGGLIADIALTRDDTRADGLAAALRGVKLSPESVRHAVRQYHEGRAAPTDSVVADLSIEEWVAAILELRRQPQGS